MAALGLPEEQLLLLTLDDETGRPVGPQGMAPGLALAGAVVMELALAGRIDTDGDRCRRWTRGRPATWCWTARWRTSRGDSAVPDSRAAILLLARHEAEMREARLVARGLLRAVDGHMLFVMTERRYPKPEGRGEPVAVRERLRGTVLHAEAIPEPRDARLLGLARAAGCRRFCSRPRS